MVERGFTLVELIVVIVLIGALAAVSAVFIVNPFRASEDLANRADLVDGADSALDRITRETRSALPGSVRVHDGGAHLEFIKIRVGGRYREGNDNGEEFACEDLRFDRQESDDCFEVLGGLAVDDDDVDPRDAGTDCADGTGDCISVGNQVQTTDNEDLVGDRPDAYERENIAALTDLEDDGDVLHYDMDDEDGVFVEGSPQNRFYIFHDVVSYRCEGDELRRYRSYGLQSGEPDLDDEPSALLAGSVQSCDFDDSQLSAQGVLAFELELARQGESIRLLDQARVVNSP